VQLIPYIDVRITERSDTSITVRIIKGSYNGDSDNRGSTVVSIFFYYKMVSKETISSLNSKIDKNYHNLLTLVSFDNIIFRNNF